MTIIFVALEKYVDNLINVLVGTSKYFMRVSNNLLN